MSNIQKTINFLRELPDKNFLSITNQETNKPVGTTKIFLRDIPNEDLAGYIKFHLGPITQPTLVWVELRKENGTSSLKKDSCAIQVNPEMTQQIAPIAQAAPAPVTQVHEATPINHLGNPFGLGLPELLKMNSDSTKLELVEKQLEKALEEIKDLKHDNRTLDLDLREQKTKVATAEQQKELAVLLATAGQKGFFDGEGFQKLLEKAPDMFEKIVAMKAGSVGEVSTLGNPNFNPVQKEFIDYVIENLSDDQIKGLGAICFYMKQPEFQAELAELLTKFEN